ncbi:MAG: hypothetical protein ACRCWC_04200 [Plesiomonas shigelloides]
MSNHFNGYNGNGYQPTGTGFEPKPPPQNPAQAERQAQQEPVAWLYHDASSLEELLAFERDGLVVTCSVLMSLKREKQYKNETPLFAAPPPNKPWAGLTPGEVDEMHWDYVDSIYGFDYLGFSRSIEAKLRERNMGQI